MSTGFCCEDFGWPRSIFLILQRSIQPPTHISNQLTTMSVKLESSDEQVFEVPREIAEMSVTVKHMLDDVDADSDAPIPLPNVTGKILAKVHLCVQLLAH